LGRAPGKRKKKHRSREGGCRGRGGITGGGKGEEDRTREKREVNVRKKERKRGCPQAKRE